MKINFIGRHFINGEATFTEFVRIREYLEVASSISLEKQFGINFGLKLTVAEDKIDDNLKERIREERNRLPEFLWLLYDPQDRGAGTSYQQVLFNPTFSVDGPSVVINGDLDQYVINTSEGLESILDLAKKVETDTALYASGSRDVPVFLATYARNSNIRIIHELFHSLTIGSDKLKVDEQKSRITPAYAEIGESTSGLYLLNHAHPRFPDLLRAVAQANREANMKGFATDYYVAIKVAQLAPLAKGYVSSRENKFYTSKDEAAELSSLQRMISTQTKELGKTDVRALLKASVCNPQNTDNLARFYPREDVELVKALMEEALSS